MHSTAEDSISSSIKAAGDGREVAAAAAAVATNTTTTASHSYYNLCNFCLVSRRGEGTRFLRGRLNSNRVLYLLKTERERDRENGTEDDDDRGNEVTSATHGGIGGAGRFR